MLASSARLRPNSAEVAAKVMDGEAIIINLTNGMYYSMDQVGGLLWELIEQGQTVSSMVDTVVATYEVDAVQARPDLERLLAELLDEQLVVDVDNYPADDHPRIAMGIRLPYLRPELHKYTDMGDLLALDPPMPTLQEFPWQQREA